MRSMGLVILLSLFGVFGARFASADRVPVGIAMNLPRGGTLTTLVRDLTAARAGGQSFETISASWRDLEPSPGVYNWKPVLDGANGLGHLGFTELVTIKTLDTNQRALPTDLNGKSFDDPEVVSRYCALLKALAAQLPASVDGISLGNEVDVYLAAHPTEVQAYLRFLKAGRQAVHDARPGLAVGVTTTYTGMAANPSLCADLNEGTDIVCMTYYPLNSDFTVQPPGNVPSDFRRMAEAAGSKPFFLQEIGYPASPLVGSSEAKQAAFVDAVFTALSSSHATIRGACFFLLYDFSDRQLAGLVGYYGLGASKFRAFLGTLGFKDTNGVPRLAWSHFQSHLRK